MTERYRFSAPAAEDLFQIWAYIARRNIDAADRVEESIYDACAFIASNRDCGQVRTDLTNRPVRFWIVPRFPNYILVYDRETEPLTIIRILHGARNVSELLG